MERRRKNGGRRASQNGYCFDIDVPKSDENKWRDGGDITYDGRGQEGKKKKRKREEKGRHKRYSFCASFDIDTPCYFR
jgi:hypothetical protein